MINYKKIAYLPIDLPKLIVQEDVILNLLDRYDTGHHDGLWKCLPLIGRVVSQENFLNAREFEKAWERRYLPSGEILYNYYVYKELKSLFDHLKLLPLTITHAQILNQTADVGKHYDLKHDETGKKYFDDYPGINDGLEPAGYKVLLNNFDKKSFYVSEAFGKPNHYIQLPEDTNTFVINEKTYPHGATMTITPKYIVSIFGLIDKEKHFHLINKSIVKYSHYAITF